MLKITSREMIKKYYDTDYLSQSELKQLAKGLDPFLAWKNKQEEDDKEEKDYLKIGKGVDTVLTGNDGDFEEEFYVMNINHGLSETEIKMINFVYNLFDDEARITNLEEGIGFLKDAAVEVDWFKGNPGENRLKTLAKKAQSYYEVLFASVGKSIITPDQKELIEKVADSLITHPKTQKYFNRVELNTNENVDVYYQMVVMHKYKGITVKALIDIVIVVRDDEGNIEKIIPIDIKTMSGYTIDFPISARKYRYDIQASWYTWVLSLAFDEKDRDKIQPFEFIVESTTNPGNPLVYKTNMEFLNHGSYGREENKAENGAITSYKTVGFLELLNDYLHYADNGWKEDRRLQEHPINLGWYGIEKSI